MDTIAPEAKTGHLLA